eukprot:6748835-Heterocapsa_arctica.AAC.1
MFISSGAVPLRRPYTPRTFAFRSCGGLETRSGTMKPCHLRTPFRGSRPGPECRGLGSGTYNVPGR